MTIDEYKKNPCKVSSLPYYKVNKLKVPENMRIVHDDDFSSELLLNYSDSRYFRLINKLDNIDKVEIDKSFKVTKASLEEYVKHINSSYEDISVSLDELKAYQNDPVYNEELWFAVRNSNDEIIGSIIAHFDNEVKEGIIDWVQVSKEYRKKHIGSFMISKVLERLKGIAEFVTVSGSCENISNPEILYRKCGFTGNDIWHILIRK